MTKLRLSLLVLALSSASAWGAWTETMTMKGDLRFRTDRVSEEVTGSDDSERLQQRIRLRMNVNAKINDHTDVYTRLASGTTSNTTTNSTNLTLEDYYAKKGIVLDLAYADVKITEGLNLWMGKTTTPFYLVGGNDMIFDSDLTQEGMAIKYKGASGSVDWMVNFAGNWIKERYSAGGSPNTEVGLLGTQAAVNIKMSTTNVLFGAANYNFTHIQGDAAPSASGNTLTGGVYDYEFNLMSYFVEVGVAAGKVPLTIYAEMVSNPDSDDSGTIYGIKANKINGKGTWMAALDYRNVEPDAVIGIFSDSDSGGGGTDIRGFRLQGSYQPAENTTASLTYFSNDKTVSGSSTTYSRILADLVFNF
jgi:hypothetical protein